MRTTPAILLAVVWTLAVANAQIKPLRPGDPLPGLTTREFAQFRLGLDDFIEVESAEEGLGPAFNGTSCAACHNVPAIGGISAILETRAATVDADGNFQPLDASGETLMHLFSIPRHGCQPVIPDTVTIIARRAPIPVFGAGLVEAIPDAAILANADPDDQNKDGVSGRAAIIHDVATRTMRVGRFGWKSQQATLLAFGAEAYRSEMGITNELFPAELAYGVTPDALKRCDASADPEDVRDRRTRRRGIDNFESFMKFLAPIERAKIGGSEQVGEALFNIIGCGSCHVPTLETGPSPNPLFDRKPVPLFSDLLLHDVGTGDGIQQGPALPSEIRTPALWGLRLRRPFLHDGRAATIEEAIRAHAGEAAGARQRFELLAEPDLKALIAFLKSL